MHLMATRDNLPRHAWQRHAGPGQTAGSPDETVSVTIR
jgi:hypothetical protein